MWVLPRGAVGSPCTCAQDLDLFNCSSALLETRCGKWATLALALAGGIDHTLPSGGSSRTPAPDRGAGPGPASKKSPGNLGAACRRPPGSQAPGARVPRHVAVAAVAAGGTRASLLAVGLSSRLQRLGSSQSRLIPRRSSRGWAAAG